MARPAIVLCLDRGTAGPGFHRRLAGLELWSDRLLAPHAAPAGPADRLDLAPLLESLRFTAEGATLVHDGAADDGGRERRVVARIDRAGVRRVDYEDGESFLVDARRGLVARVAGPPADDPGRSLERALGAPLALALAARGVHLLHASAIAGEAGVVALTAGSGTGKSTMAAHAAIAGSHRIADDLLPVRLGAEPLALPHFPQLKLPAAEQYPEAGPAELPLAAIVELVRVEPGAPIRVEPLEPAAGALLLAAATVAARLFDGELLAGHLAACAAASTGLRAGRLRYPSGYERLPEVLDRLQQARFVAG